MSDVDIAETTLTHRVVLVGLAALADDDATPAHAGEVRRVCTGRLDAVEADVVGTLTEAEVSRTLKELEGAGLVEATRDDTSATGKGRPHYAPAADRDALLDELAADDRLGDVVERATA